MRLREKTLAAAVLFIILGLVCARVALSQETCEPERPYNEAAAVAVANNDFDGAMRLYDCAITLNPADYSAYLGRIFASLLTNRYPQAFQDYAYIMASQPAVIPVTVRATTEMIWAQPEAMSSRVLRSFLFAMVGDTAHAQEDLDVLLSLSPDNVYAHLFKGLTLHQQGNVEAGDHEVAVALDLAPGNPDVQYVAAVAYRSTARPDWALAYLDQALLARPDDTFLLAERARAYTDAGNFDMARAQYDRIVALLPDNRQSYIQRGGFLEGTGDLAAAEADYLQALALWPEDADAHQRIGWIRLKSGDLAAAQSQFDQAIEINPLVALSFLGRGTTRTLSGALQAGAEDYLRYLALRTSNVVDLSLVDNSATLTMTRGLLYRIRVEAEPGQRLTVLARSADQLVDSLIVLVGPDGVPLQGCDDLSFGSTNYDAVVAEVVLPQAGIYTVLVSHAGGGSEGTVDVSMTLNG